MTDGAVLSWLGRLPDDHVFVEDAGGSHTAASFRALVGRLAGAMATFPPGSRAAVCSKNRAEYGAAYLAARTVGVVLVPLNHGLKAPELAFQLEDGQVCAVFVGAPLTAAVAPLRAASAGTAWWALDEVDGWDPVPDHPAPAPRAVPADEPWVQMYTSGTTGRPKGALVTEANLVALVDAWDVEMPLGPADRVLQVTPLFHVGALLMFLATLRAGSTLVLPPEFSPGRVIAALSTGGVTHTLLVPAMIRWTLMELARTPDATFPHLKMVAYGAAPIPASLMAQARAVFRCDWLQGYGLTETAGVLTVLSPSDHHVPGLEASAGKAVGCCEIAIVDADDRAVAVGVVGEVVARGANVSPGYHHLPDATAEALRGGWFHTGDAGYVDERGYLFLVDRVKDMILVGGENVYSREVEAVLEACPGVREAAVIGVPHDVWGEVVYALVAAAPGADAAALPAEVVARCREHLARFKCPQTVEIVDALPRNAAGKVLKAQLRAPHWAGRDRNI